MIGREGGGKGERRRERIPCISSAVVFIFVKTIRRFCLLWFGNLKRRCQLRFLASSQSMVERVESLTLQEKMDEQ